MPPRGDNMNNFVSNTNETGVFLLTLNWYLDRRETNPTLVCISPDRIPAKEKQDVNFRVKECRALLCAISSAGITV
jgi:hypothetical protein